MLSNNDLPLVSIVTPVWNGESFIRDCIDSIQAQTYPNIQHIIIDGGSTDRTIEIVKSYGNKIAKVVSERDKGIYDAMNKGIALADGQIIGILNCDDMYEPHAVELAVKALQETNAPFVHGDQARMDLSGNVYGIRVPIPMDEYQHFFAQAMPISHPTVFMQRETYEKYGVFSMKWRLSSDMELFVRLYRQGVWGHYIPEVLARFRDGGASASVRSLSETRDIAIEYGMSPFIAYARWAKTIVQNWVADHLPKKALKVISRYRHGYTRYV